MTERESEHLEPNKILGLNGKPINQESRKSRREKEIYQNKLLVLTNQYFLFCQRIENEELRTQKFKELNRTWIEFVIKWNNDLTHEQGLRIIDFSNFVEYYKTKQNDGNSNK